MQWNHSLNGDNSGPIVRDMPLFDASDIAEGEALTYGADVRGALLITSGALGADFVGVAQETITASTTDLTTGTIIYGKVIIDPLGVYRVEYDLAAANDIDVVSSTSTATTLGTSDDDLEGSWLFVNSGTGVGQLAFIGAASTTVMTLDTSAAWTVTPDSGSDVILIRKPLRFAANSGKDLNAAGILAASDEDETGEYLVMENYLESRLHSSQPLRPDKDHMRQDLDSADVRFYTDLYPTDHILRGATTMS